MMDDFSFMYQEEDIVHALSMKCWPAQIQETINDGRDKIGSVTEEMVLKLEQDKEEFGRNMQSYKDTFKKIQTFNSVDQVIPFAKDAKILDNNIKDASTSCEQFNLRETRLNQPLTQYPDLETLRTDFIPFFDLLDTAYSAIMNLTDYYQSPLVN